MLELLCIIVNIKRSQINRKRKRWLQDDRVKKKRKYYKQKIPRIFLADGACGAREQYRRYGGFDNRRKHARKRVNGGDQRSFAG